jgi:hypothetical protein
VVAKTLKEHLIVEVHTLVATQQGMMVIALLIQLPEVLNL